LPPGRPDPQVELDPTKPIHIMLIDLGLATIFRPGGVSDGHVRGSPATMAPEVWRCIETPAADIFSYGATLFFLLTGNYPFQVPVGDLCDSIDYWNCHPKHAPYTAGSMYSNSAYNFCDKLLAIRRQKRPTVAQCLQDDFFLKDEPLKSMGPEVNERLQRLAKAPDRSLLYRSVALELASLWPSYRLPSIRRAFEELDVAGTGRLHKAQFVQALIGLGVERDTAQKAFEAVDLSRDDLVDWTEFVAACIKLSCSSLDDDLRDLFSMADGDGDGFLDRRDLTKLLKTEHLSAEAADSTIRELVGSSESSKKVDWPTFHRHFRSICIDREQAPHQP